MAGITRASILRGPALVTFGGATFFSKGDITVRHTRELFDIETAHAGIIDRRDTDRRIEIEFEPAGEVEALTVLLPYAATVPGASIFGTSDSPLVVHTVAGKKYTFHAAAVTGMPRLRFGVGATMFGAVTFTAILKNNAEPSDANGYYTLANEAYPGNTAFVPAGIYTPPYVATYTGHTWAAQTFRSETPFEVNFDLNLRAETVDGLGTIDMTFVNIDASVSCIPVGPSVEELLDAMDHQAIALGDSKMYNPETRNLVIGGNVTPAPSINFYLYGASLLDADFGHSTGRKTIGTCVWRAHVLTGPKFALTVD